MEGLCSAGLAIATVDGDKIYDDASLRADLMTVFEILMCGSVWKRDPVRGGGA